MKAGRRRAVAARRERMGGAAGRAELSALPGGEPEARVRPEQRGSEPWRPEAVGQGLPPLPDLADAG